MSATNDGGPIAASIEQGNNGSLVSVGGLSKREWLAGMALQGYLVNNGTDTPEGAIVEWSLSTADAMLAALSKKGGDQ